MLRGAGVEANPIQILQTNRQSYLGRRMVKRRLVLSRHQQKKQDSSTRQESSSVISEHYTLHTLLPYPCPDEMRKALRTPVDGLIEDLASSSSNQQTGNEGHAASLCVLVQVVANHISRCFDAESVDDDGLQKVIA